MQEVKFRGKNQKTGEWVYGYYYENALPLQCLSSDRDDKEKKECFIICAGFADWNMPRTMYKVDVVEETVGQYVGLKDKKGLGKEMFEGDIFKDWQGKLSIIRKDVYLWKFEAIKEDFKYREDFYNVGEVIGNIFDNAGLIS